MIESINISDQTVLPNNNVLFSTDAVRTRCFNCCNGFNHSLGSGLFTLNKDGIYEIDFNANVSSATAGTINFDIKNTEVLQGSQMIVTNVANNIYNISAKRLVRVCGGSAIISVGNIGANPVIVSNPNIIIKKIA